MDLLEPLEGRQSAPKASLNDGGWKTFLVDPCLTAVIGPEATEAKKVCGQPESKKKSVREGLPPLKMNCKNPAFLFLLLVDPLKHLSG